MEACIMILCKNSESFDPSISCIMFSWLGCTLSWIKFSTLSSSSLMSLSCSPIAPSWFSYTSSWVVKLVLRSSYSFYREIIFYSRSWTFDSWFAVYSLWRIAISSWAAFSLRPRSMDYFIITGLPYLLFIKIAVHANISEWFIGLPKLLREFCILLSLNL